MDRIESIATSLLLSLIVFFSPIAPLLIMVGTFIFTDTIFGLVSSYKTKTPIVSRKLSRVISKMFVYQGVVLLFYVIDNLIINDIIMLSLSVPFILTKIVSLMLVSIECFSIDEKIRGFNNGKGVSFYFKRLLKLAKDLKKEYNEINGDN